MADQDEKPTVETALTQRLQALEAENRVLRDSLEAAQDAARRSEERFSLVMTGPNEGIWEWDPGTKALRLSTRLMSILGFEGGTLYTTSHEWLKLVHPEDRHAYQRALIDHLKGKTPHFESQYRVKDANGDYRWCLARGLAQFDDQGRAWRMVGSIGDVTLLRQSLDALEKAHGELEKRVEDRTRDLRREIAERQRIENELLNAKEQAEIASRAKSEFLANMSHELRTPLNAIIGFSEMISSALLGPLGNDKYREYGQIIHESGGHLLELINDILDLSKIEAGKMDLHLEPVPLKALISGCMALVADQAKRATLMIYQDVPEDLPLVLADSLRLRQVMLNLLSNAVKFTPGGGAVGVVARLAPGQKAVGIEVRDSGIGMSKEGMERAMQPFGQVDSHLARKYQGTGLGLPLARRLMELHGGSLTLKSIPGRGTTVQLGLPILPSLVAEDD